MSRVPRPLFIQSPGRAGRRLLVLVTLRMLADLAAADPTVGMPGLAEVLLPRGDLRAAAPHPRDEVHVRILSCAEEGGAYRYRLSWTAYRSGELDLAGALRAGDGAQCALPSIPVRVTSLRQPDEWELRPGPPLGYGPQGWYAPALYAGGAVWLLAGLLVLGWKLRPRPRLVMPAGPPDELPRLLALARAGNVPPADLATLERLLLQRWRQEPSLHGLDPAAALARLRAGSAGQNEAKASVPLNQARSSPASALVLLETWLHASPGPASAAAAQSLLTVLDAEAGT